MTRTDEALGQRSRRIRRVLWAVLVLNVAVASAKLVYGILTNSAAMEADGFHSFFDGAANVVGLTGMWFAARPPDDSHPYGHAKFEAFTAAAIAGMLVFAGYNVGRSALESLSGSGEPTRVTTLSFAIMLGTLAVNIAVTTWERRAGRRLGSEVLIADASHTFSDVLVSVGVIASLILVAAGLTQADGVVALLVALVILRTAFTVIRRAALTLGDAARLPADEIAAVVGQIPGVIECHSIRTRGLESQVYVDLHVLVAAETSVESGHAIAHQAEDVLCRRFTQIADVVVHVEPAPA